jgi:aryl carrier-like protein
VKKSLENVLGVKVCSNTIRSNLKQLGLKAKPKLKKPLLTARHQHLRLEFAKRYKEWTIEDWKRIIWSDETKINRMGSDGKVWCWKKPGSQLESRHVNQTVKFGDGSLMVWVAITSKGVGYLANIDGIMDKGLYLEILKDDLVQTIQNMAVIQRMLSSNMIMF